MNRKKRLHHHHPVFYPPDIITVFVPVPTIEPVPPVAFISVPPAGSKSTTGSSQSQAEMRETGYHRSDASSSTQAATPASPERTNGSTRSRR
jgi:hypothetical protein